MQSKPWRAARHPQLWLLATNVCVLIIYATSLRSLILLILFFFCDLIDSFLVLRHGESESVIVKIADHCRAGLLRDGVAPFLQWVASERWGLVVRCGSSSRNRGRSLVILIIKVWDLFVSQDLLNDLSVAVPKCAESWFVLLFHTEGLWTTGSLRRHFRRLLLLFLLWIEEVLRAVCTVVACPFLWFVLINIEIFLFIIVLWSWSIALRGTAWRRWLCLNVTLLRRPRSDGGKAYYPCLVWLRHLFENRKSCFRLIDLIIICRSALLVMSLSYGLALRLWLQYDPKGCVCSSHLRLVSSMRSVVLWRSGSPALGRSVHCETIHGIAHSLPTWGPREILGLLRTSRGNYSCLLLLIHSRVELWYDKWGEQLAVIWFTFAWVFQNLFIAR